MSLTGPDDNPYAAPEAVATAGAQEGRAERPWTILWTAVFVVNLFVPLLFGWGLTSQGGRIGMTLAAAVLLGVGFLVGGRSRELRHNLTAGGILVALSQFVPFLQVLAGLAGMAVVERLLGLHIGPGSEDGTISPPSEVASFLFTLITGGLLIAAAVVIGLVARMVTGMLGWRRVASVENAAAERGIIGNAQRGRAG
jgi:hypothetical protein